MVLSIIHAVPLRWQCFCPHASTEWMYLTISHKSQKKCSIKQKWFIISYNFDSCFSNPQLTHACLHTSKLVCGKFISYKSKSFSGVSRHVVHWLLIHSCFSSNFFDACFPCRFWIIYVKAIRGNFPTLCFHTFPQHIDEPDRAFTI